MGRRRSRSRDDKEGIGVAKLTQRQAAPGMAGADPGTQSGGVFRLASNAVARVVAALVVELDWRTPD